MKVPLRRAAWEQQRAAAEDALVSLERLHEVMAAYAVADDNRRRAEAAEAQLTEAAAIIESGFTAEGTVGEWERRARAFLARVSPVPEEEK